MNCFIIDTIRLGEFCTNSVPFFLKTRVRIILDFHCSHDSKINNGFSNSLSQQEHSYPDRMVNGFLNEGELGMIDPMLLMKNRVNIEFTPIRFKICRSFRLFKKKEKHRL